MAAPVRALGPGGAPRPRDPRLRLTIEFADVEPVDPAIAFQGRMEFLLDGAELSRNILDHVLRYMGLNRGGLNVPAAPGQAAVAVNAGIQVPRRPDLEVRFTPLDNGNSRCNLCVEEVAPADLVVHANRHRNPPQVIDMHEVPPVAPEPPQGAGDVDVGRGIEPAAADEPAGAGAPAAEAPP